jgi:GMP synthase-like glutamine amidotransferase
MKIQVFQHVAFEGPAYISEIAEMYSCGIQICRFDKHQKPMPPNSYDILVIMGGPMSVNDEEAYSWIKTEKKAIEQAIIKGKTVIGFCLGAQLIASVLGSTVYQNTEKEIGWFPVSRVQAGTGNPPLHFLPDIATVFHWHGETFNLPENSVRLFSSEVTHNQAFLYGNKVLGMQFHLEMKEQGIVDLIKFCKSDLTEGRYIMSPEEMHENYKRYESSNKKMLRNLFRYYLG